MRQKMTKPLFMITGLTVLAILAAGCSSLDSAIGKTKSAPDEFQVVVRPPLTLPPNFKLRPGAEGSEQQEVATVASIRNDAVAISDQVLTLSRAADGSVFDAVLGTDERLANIRDIVDAETLGIQVERRLPAQILFGDTPNIGPTLDALDERKRIRQAQEEGRPVNEDPTPATDSVNGASIAIE
jgi:hypothetical protein